MNLDDLTIVIPTHERSNLLKRSLDYYKDWKCSIIIADSSKDKYIGIIPENTNYLHLDQYGFSNKLLFALRTVKSTYTCFCADDDFLSPQGLMTGIAFLNNNRDYVSMQGHYISFKITKKSIEKFIIYHQRLEYKADLDIPAERLVQAFSPYMQHFYALHHTEALIKSMELASKVPTLICAELSVALIPMLIGKHKMLPIFWMARDSSVYSQYSTSEDSPNRIIKNWLQYLSSDEGHLFAKAFSGFYHRYGCGSADQGQFLIQKVFSIYDGKPFSKATGYRQKLKKILPKFIVVLIRMIKSFYYNNLYRRLNTTRLRILRIPGYPWEDKTARQEWHQMKKVITKHLLDDK